MATALISARAPCRPFLTCRPSAGRQLATPRALQSTEAVQQQAGAAAAPLPATYRRLVARRTGGSFREVAEVEEATLPAQLGEGEVSRQATGSVLCSAVGSPADMLRTNKSDGGTSNAPCPPSLPDLHIYIHIQGITTENHSCMYASIEGFAAAGAGAGAVRRGQRWLRDLPGARGVRVSGSMACGQLVTSAWG